MQCYVVFKAIDQVFLLARRNEHLTYLMFEERGSCASFSLAKIESGDYYSIAELLDYGVAKPVPQYTEFYRQGLPGRNIGQRVIHPRSAVTETRTPVYVFAAEQAGFEVYQKENYTQFEIHVAGETHDFNYTSKHLYFFHEHVLYDFDVVQLSAVKTNAVKLLGGEHMYLPSITFAYVAPLDQFVHSVILHEQGGSTIVEKQMHLVRRLDLPESDFAADPGEKRDTRRYSVPEDRDDAFVQPRKYKEEVKQADSGTQKQEYASIPTYKFAKFELPVVPETYNVNGRLLVGNQTLAFCVLGGSLIVLALVLAYESSLASLG